MKIVLFTVSLILTFSAQAASSSGTFQMSPADYANAVSGVQVPAGNYNQAEIRDYDEGDYQAAVDTLMKDDYVCVVKRAAYLFNVDPMDILGSIIGEHTFNVNVWDYGQDGYMSMVGKWYARFESNGMSLSDLVKEKKYAACTASTDNNYDLWSCYNDLWHADKRGDGRDLKWTFFNPVGAGYTYGFGQMGPERALMVTDLVNQVIGLPVVTIDDPKTLYENILDPQKSIYYVAANNRLAIDTYIKYAHFDVSANPGIVATLYNLGKERDKAEDSYEKTVAALTKKGRAAYPQVNYYGWFINSKVPEIQKLYDRAAKRCGAN